MHNYNPEIVAKQASLGIKDIHYFSAVARKAAYKGGEVLNKNFGKISSIKSKGRIGDLVTNADLEAEKVVIDYLNNECPELSILAEESGSKGETNLLTWCIDPLDGTTNYAHGYPFFATSIGLLWEMKPILGAIYAPALNEEFWCIPGKGSYCNDTPISVSIVSELVDSLLVTGFAYDRQTTSDNNYAEFCKLTHLTRGVRRAGAASVDLAYVAAGRIDGYWERGLSPWDLAAGVAIASVAGAEIADYKGGNFNIETGRVLACNAALKKPLLKELGNIKPLPGATYGFPGIDSMGS